MEAPGCPVLVGACSAAGAAAAAPGKMPVLVPVPTGQAPECRGTPPCEAGWGMRQGTLLHLWH